MIGTLVLSTASVITLLLAGIAGALSIYVIVRLRISHIVVVLLFFWTTIESVALKFVPIEWYSFFRYGGELLVYALFVASLYVAYREHRLFRFPMRRVWIAGGIFVGIGIVSYLFNLYHPFDWLLGMRQLFRYVLLGLSIYWFGYPHKVRRSMLIGVLVVCAFQAGIGLVQYASGGRLDALFLAPSDITIGNVAVITGVDERWVKGNRIFGTLGRYDRFGSVMAVALILAVALWYYVPASKKRMVLLLMGLFAIALLLSVSRASWLMGLGGVSAIAFWLQKDRQAIRLAGLGILALAVYLGSFYLQPGSVRTIVETPDQSIAERVFEAVSPTAIRESYYGFGRVFFIVHTPITVVPSAPLFGVGPGRYGGGVAAARLNTDVYDKLVLPFGIEGRFGQIDNSWFALWGEFGTLGILALLYGMYWCVQYAKTSLHREYGVLHNTLFTGMIGVIVGTGIVGFFGPYFELRGFTMLLAILVGLTLLEYDIRSQWYRPNYLDR